MTRVTSVAVSFVWAYLSWAGSSHAEADAVVDWNAIAMQTAETAIAATPPRPRPITLLDLATVQAAVYDAVQAIEREFEPFLVEIPGASGSPAAAAARAAHDVLVGIYPAQTASLDTTYHDYLASHGIDEDDPGAAVGQKAAAGVLARRADDGRMPDPPPPPFVGGTETGMWRPTQSFLPGPPLSYEPMAVSWLGSVTPFTLKDQAQFRPRPPPSLTSARYARAYDEVKAMGSAVDSARTPEQTELAIFWVPTRGNQWNRAIRDIVATHVDDISDSSRLFALANLAAADTYITAWNTKSHFVTWRPLTAIQEGENDGNRRTVGDPGWQPMINTPNHPDYTSGANVVAGAMTRSLQLFFRTDEFTFVMTSGNPLASPQTRTFHRFSDAAQEVEDARVYQGVHFRFADTIGRQQGRLVAGWVFKHYLRPLRR